MEANKSVRQLLRDKGAAVWTVEPEASVLDALRRMAERNVGALVVVSGGRLVGIFSERDYARKVVLKGKASVDTPVREIMTPDVISVGPDQTVQECMQLMTAHRIRHLPVLEDGQLCGLVSIGDAVKSIMLEQAYVIEQLQTYIQGGA